MPDFSKIIYGGATYTVKDEASRSALVELIDSGPKNKIEMTQTQETITKGNITATFDKVAGTITLNGYNTSGNSAIFEFYSGNATDQRYIPAGKYHMSGCPAGGSTSTYRCMLNGISSAVDIGNGVTFTLTAPKYAAYRILISGNCTFNNTMFKPMVCLEELYKISPAFQPYRPSYQELYEMVKALQS